MTLATIAALTKKLILGTAVIVTYRHPLVTSQLFGTLAYVANGRLMPGIGAGTPRAPFDAVGLPYEKRGRIVEELIQILRLTWSQEHVSFHGEFYNFDDMTIDPRPPMDTPIYYGGLTNASIRRTAKYCDGWLPHHTPFKILDRMISYMRELEEIQQRKKPISITYFPLASIDRDSTRARKRIRPEGIIEELGRMIREKKWKGICAREEELNGSIVVGSPQECVDQVASFQERRFDEIVFDLRNTFDEWETSIELLATQVLPHFKEG